MRDIAREQLLAELRALKPQFEREGVARMAMFGSRARGDNRPDSDVDLVIEVEPGRKFSMIDAAGLYGVIEDRIGLESSIVVFDDYTDPDFVRTVQRDRVEVF
jgi:predicted nucleotidyltransferase